MNKGEHTRLLIAAGHDDAYIAEQTGSTINSVRWHRSKIKKNGSKPSRSAAPAKSKILTVGDIANDEHRETVIKAIMQSCEKSREDAEHFWQRVSKWTFIYGKNLGGRYGQCHYGKRRIEVHEGIKDLIRDFRETFLHEIAHAVTYMVYERNCNHGFRWKRFMAAMGLPTNATGAPSAEARAVLNEIRQSKRAAKKPYQIWECECCGHKIDIFAKRKYHASLYTHRGCGGRFKVVGS